MKDKGGAVLFVLLCFATFTSAQEPDRKDPMQNCPMHKEQARANSHQALVDKHGDEAMGFSHLRTTHHFVLLGTGGGITVTANDVADKASTDAIRVHLSHIAIMFGNGDFSAPMFIHDGIPPGVTTMKLLRSHINYKYQEISGGGSVLVESNDPVAVAAIHDFLRFQISQHQTGDPLTVGDEY